MPERGGSARNVLTLEEVAELFQVSLRTIQREVAAGRLRVIAVGRARRVTHRELEAFIAASRVKVA